MDSQKALLWTAVFGALSTSLGSEKTGGPVGPFSSAVQSSGQEPAPCFRPSGFEARILWLTGCSFTLLESGLCLRNRQTVIEATLWGRGVKLKENLYTSLWQNCKAKTGSSTSPDSAFQYIQSSHTQAILPVQSLQASPDQMETQTQSG